jgi:hypothetical protein
MYSWKTFTKSITFDTFESSKTRQKHIARNRKQCQVATQSDKSFVSFLLWIHQDDVSQLAQSHICSHLYLMPVHSVQQKAPIWTVKCIETGQWSFVGTIWLVKIGKFVNCLIVVHYDPFVYCAVCSMLILSVLVRKLKHALRIELYTICIYRSGLSKAFRSSLCTVLSVLSKLLAPSLSYTKTCTLKTMSSQHVCGFRKVYRSDNCDCCLKELQFAHALYI